MSLRIVYISFLLIANLKAVAQKANHSVLSEGDWFKIAILETGAYQIDNSLLQTLGMNSEGVDARRIAIFGTDLNGMLPQSNAASRPDDLSELATYKNGLSDGSFDDEDYILFFGQSSDYLSFDKETEQFHFERNLYSDTSFYFITILNRNSRNMTSVDYSQGTEEISQYLTIETHEIESTNLLSTGRNWYGEKVSQVSRTTSIPFSSQGIISASDLMVYTQVLSTGTAPSSFDLSLNGLSLGRIEHEAVSSEPYQTRANIQLDSFQINTSQISLGEEIQLEYSFSPEGVADGYVDFAHLVSTKALSVENSPVDFFHRSGVQGYAISDVSSGQVWDVSQTNSPSLISSSTFYPPQSAQRFFAFNEGQELVPIAIGRINNQDLHGLPAVEVIYITHRDFRLATQTLADFRQENDDLSTVVVTAQEIYNEYSSGRQDVTALRDFIKHQYDKHGQLRYVTLVGDCSYDYKGREIQDTNFVPIYESRNSIHEIESYSSDDYFGFLDVQEGEWVESELGDHTMEIGIGRIPAQSAEEVELYVSKMIRYEQHSDRFGRWRNSMAFIADDGDGNIHQNDAERLSAVVSENQNVFNIDKIYLDEFEQIDQPNGQESPAAKEQFLNALTNGNIIVNYTGHGNIGQLMDERVFEDDQVDDLENRHLMPFFVTATCEFGNYDNPRWVSGGERILLHNAGGAIALLCSARPVFSNTNFLLNEAFYRAAMSKSGGQFQRLGDIMRITKNTSLVGTRNRNYALLGDASMKLAFPDQGARLTQINGTNGNSQDTLKALGKYQISGEILLANGSVDTQFNGSTVVSVFDKPSSFKTKGDESPSQVFNRQDVLLFQGEVTVISGQFSSEFIIPINIDYSFAPGKIGFYGLHENNQSDAHGANSSFIVGGSSDNFENDNTPPEIDIYLNETSFESGNTVGRNSTLLVHLLDEHGINTSRLGFGADLKFQLDDQDETIVNEYYTAALDSYQEGWVTYPLQNLSIGEHTLRFEAFDVYNNRSEAVISFRVTDKLPLKLTNVTNYPNPMFDQTTFTFTHDREGEELVARMIIMNFQGQVILDQEYRFLDSPTRIDNIDWDGSDAHGNPLKKGTYIYKLIVQSRQDGAKSTQFEKLIILN